MISKKNIFSENDSKIKDNGSSQDSLLNHI